MGSVKIVASKVDNNIEVSIFDTGIGIADNSQKNSLIHFIKLMVVSPVNMVVQD